MIKWILCVLFGFVSPLFAAPCDGQEADQAYQSGNFALAAQIWEKCAEDGVHNADLYYNWGNAAFRLGQIGRAIWAYEAALRLQPSHSDALNNRELARARAVDKIPQETSEDNPLLLVFWKLLHLLSTNQQWGLFLGLLWVLALLVFLSYRTPAGLWHTTSLVSLLFASGIAALVFLLALFKTYSFETQHHAVLFVRSSDIMSGPGEKYQVLHELHEGTVVEVLEEGDAWSHVRLSEDVQGFIRTVDIKVVP